MAELICIIFDHQVDPPYQFTVGWFCGPLTTGSCAFCTLTVAATDRQPAGGESGVPVRARSRQRPVCSLLASQWENEPVSPWTHKSSESPSGSCGVCAHWGLVESLIHLLSPQLPFDFTWKMLKDKFNECGKCLRKAF